MPRSLRCALAVLALVAAACGSPAGPDDGRLHVVTTVSPITNIVQNVGGDRIVAHRHRPGGVEQPHVRAGTLGRPGPGRGRRGVHQRPAPRGADPGAGRGQRARGGADRLARRDDDLARPVRLRLQLSRGAGRPEPPPVDRPAVREALRGDRPRRALQARPRRDAHVRRQLRGVRRPHRRPRRPGPGGDRDRPSREPQAPHLPRLLPVLRARVRLEGHRGHPALGLLRADPGRGRRPHRPDQGRARAGHLRVRGVPQPRPAADRRRDRREATSTTCATTTSPARTATRTTATSG